MPQDTFGWLYIMGLTLLKAMSTEYEPNIIIVGAGSSGIAAASKLYEHGFRNVTILEAESRIGGRVYTKWFDNKWIDLGGQSVHGQIDNVVYELASPHGLLEVPKGTGVEFAVYNSNGDWIPPSVADSIIAMYFDLVETDLEGKNGSVGEYMTEILNNEFEYYLTVDEPLKNSFMQLFEGFTKASDASDTWFSTSAKGYTEYWDCPGNQVVNWKDKGYSMLFDLLTKKIPNPREELPVFKNTHLNSEVVNIDYSTANGRALVKTTNGRIYEADHVIVTTSLGVLKAQHETLFTPRLPELKVNSINGLAFGVVGKVIVSFSGEWWPSDWINVGFIWNESDRREYENDPDKKWLLDFIAFTKLPYKRGVLVGWVNDPGCRYMETLSEDQLMHQTFGLLRKFLGKSFNIPRPTKILRSNWYTNKHFRGSYSYRSMESERVHASAEDLATPIIVNGSPVVLFAGEATNTRHYSTVNGAVETGIREANRLIKIYKDTQN